MNFFKKQLTMDYNTIYDDDDAIVVAEQQPTALTRNHGRRTKMADVLFLSAAAAGMLLVAAVVLRGGQDYHAASNDGVRGTPASTAEGMVVASTRIPQYDHLCVVPPAPPAHRFPIFGGISTQPGEGYRFGTTPFETCCKGPGEFEYCWTRSFALSNPTRQAICAPKGGEWGFQSAVNLVPNHSCGPACQILEWF